MASIISRVGCLRLPSAVVRSHIKSGHSAAVTVPSDGTVYSPLPKAEQEFRDKHLSRIGNRDIVGFGRNGAYFYADSITYPYPAIRWAQNTPQTDALMKKAEGSWKNLTAEEKKALYRHSFCQTYAEINAPNSEWKIVLGFILAALSASCWVYMYMRNNVYDAMLPPTITRDHHRAQEARMIAQRQGLVDGIGSRWDYEANDWKKK